MTKHTIVRAAALRPGNVAIQPTTGRPVVIREAETVRVAYRGGETAALSIRAYDPGTRQDIVAYVPLTQTWRVYA